MLNLCASLQAATALGGTKPGVTVAMETLSTIKEAKAATLLEGMDGMANATEATGVTAKEADTEAVGVGLTGWHLRVCCVQILASGFGPGLQCHA